MSAEPDDLQRAAALVPDRDARTEMAYRDVADETALSDITSSQLRTAAQQIDALFERLAATCGEMPDSAPLVRDDRER